MRPFVADPDFTLYLGDCLDVLGELETASVDAVVTSPPYMDTRSEYPCPTVEEFESIFKQLGRVCRGGMLWNVGRFWRGGVEQLWWLDLIERAGHTGWEHWDSAVWLKPNANPIKGRVLTDAHEYVLVMGRPGVQFNEDAVRSEYAPESLARYQRKFMANAGVKGYDRPAHRRKQPGIANEGGARARSFLVGFTGREKGNPHPAPMALDVAEWLVQLASWPGQTILDPFAGSGTTSLAARMHGRKSVAIERDRDYAVLAATRLSQLSLLTEEPAA